MTYSVSSAEQLWPPCWVISVISEFTKHFGQKSFSITKLFLKMTILARYAPNWTKKV